MSNIVGIDTEHEADNTLATTMLRDLCDAYPGHGWFVVIKGGVVHIKNLDMSDKWGMAIHYAEIKDDAKERKRNLIRSAGEFLERAGLRRGARTEQPVTQIEGVKNMRPGL